MSKTISIAIFFLCSLFGFVSAQTPDWQNMDLQKDGFFGISTEKAYAQLLKGKTPHPVIVAVIDAGVDTNHEDLKAVLWRNPNPRAFDNGTYGWSFIGSAKGNVQYDNLEVTRQVRQLEAADTNKLSHSNLMAYHTEKADLSRQQKSAQQTLAYYQGFQRIMKNMLKKMGKDTPALADFKAYRPQDGQEKYVSQQVIASLSDNDNFADFENYQNGAIEHFREQTEYQLNTAYDPRAIVGDDYFDSRQKNYGSPDVMGPDAEHGTHVAGIIGAIRNNGMGLNGIADDVQLMSIRAVPDGDERDKDIANAIRYAADHGAKVINMSFGKPYSQDKKAVDEAVKYALEKDVLLVQAAGNSNEDIDTSANFPNRKYLNGKEAGAWIVVGASGMKNDSTLKASFSNYGKTAVDVFAPGVQVYSSIPYSQYAYFSGTSMASPVVSGMAALIREYHPKLSAMQVKEIILESVVVTPYLKDRCSTGGVINAFNALALAAQLDQ